MTANSGAPTEPKLFRTLGQDAHHVWRDVSRTGLFPPIKRTFRDLQTFYLSVPSRDRLGAMPKVRRMFYLAGALLKSLFLKLTPTRRVLLAISFVLMWQAGSIERYGDATTVNVRFPFLAIIVLLLILMLELKDKLVAKSELEAGRSVQQALMPRASPSIPGWDLWLFTRSANDVGGDLVDYLQLAEQRFGIVLGDVAGKGLPAALLMAKLQATLRALVTEESSLAALGSKMNQILCRDGLSNRFATLVYLEVSFGSGHIRLLNAGHMPPLSLTGSTLVELPRGDMALGMLPGAGFSEQQVSLDIDDALVVFSDGLTEGMNSAEEFFGEERLRTKLLGVRGLPAREIGARVVAAVDEFVGDQPPHDDLSLVILRRTA